MKEKIYIALFTFLISTNFLLAQVDHWETVVDQGVECKYIIPSSQPASTWTSAGFDDANWLAGISPLGYGESNVQTQVPAGSMSIYLRLPFTITNIDEIEEVMFHMDYDDGFVAYINGTEITRSLVDGNPPAWNQPSSDLHESTLYQGVAPEGIILDKSVLNNGDNILAVEVHNANSTSSDLMAIPFLSVGVNVANGGYGATPSWFMPPLTSLQTHLPIIKINTNGLSIVDEPKIPATIQIIHDPAKPFNSINDPANVLDWYCGIEFRGESSQGFPKKNYGIEIWDALGADMDTTFLNFPSEEDFILHGPYSDKSLINNALTMFLGRELGHYASRIRFVELIVNDDYKGVYVVMERIKRDQNRVDIAKLNPDEITGDDLTGGYIFRIDKGNNNNGWLSNYEVFNGQGWNIYFQYYVPDVVDIVPAQANYIRNYMNQFENAVADADYINSQNKHYTDYIDLRSFVDTFILNELSKNIDAWRLSTYFFKDKDSKGGKVNAGPLWDFNLAWGNADYCGGNLIAGWEYYQCDHAGHPFWWDRMLQDTVFSNALKCRWTELRTGKLSTNRLMNVVDSLDNVIGDAADRNFQRWPILGSYVWPNPDYFITPTTHDNVMATTKNWISLRSQWIDNNIPGQAQYCELYENFNYWSLVTSTKDKIDQSLMMYPNPAEHQLTFFHEAGLEEIEILDQSGRRQIHYQPRENSFTFSMETLPRGVYIARIRTGTGWFVRKLVKE